MIIILPVLIAVAFVTLLERKILGYSQLRVGPNKVRFIGILQPFTDAIKLFIKFIQTNNNSNSSIFIGAPVIMFVIVSILWFSIASIIFYSGWGIQWIFFIMVLGMGVYPLLLTGWRSNRKYAIMGSIRGVAQTISYEIRIALLIIVIIFMLSSLKIGGAAASGKFFLLITSVIILWLIMAVAETNRTPFDFSEGESELVSGFNIEYGSVGFVLIFLREYAMILMFSSLSIIMFAGPQLFGPWGALLSCLITSGWIILRATFPRYRYDLLMALAWKSLLPESLAVLIFVTII